MEARERCEAILALIDEVIGAVDAKVPAVVLAPAHVRSRGRVDLRTEREVVR